MSPASKKDCGLPSEAELQRHCGQLYVTHGLESFCGMLLFVFFAVVAVKLHARSHLRSPAVAFIRFCFFHMYEFADEFMTTLATVGQMNELKLEARLRFCGNLDKMTNAASALLSLLGVTRWLSIGNVNGMRYIGYAMTCPFTQLEIVVMIAPIVPYYRTVAFFVVFTTAMTLTMGYVASLLWMPVWDGNLLTFMNTWDMDELAPTVKLYAVSPALLGITVLWIFVLPYFVFIYTMHGGNKNEDLPQEYRYLVALVWFTWICFPIWWFLSWEGNAVITDTKVNEIGFTVLNMVAKGLFTLQGFRVGELNEERQRARRGKSGGLGDMDVPPIISRASSRKLSASKFVQILRAYDEDAEAMSDEEEESEDEEDSEDEGGTDRLKKTGVGKSTDKGRQQPTFGARQ